jgi:hypothetical protein
VPGGVLTADRRHDGQEMSEILSRGFVNDPEVFCRCFGAPEPAILFGFVQFCDEFVSWDCAAKALFLSVKVNFPKKTWA